MHGLGHIAIQLPTGLWDVHETCPWTLAMACYTHNENAASLIAEQVANWPKAEYSGLTEDEVKAIPSDKVFFIKQGE